jgi:hypothetical protein
MDALVKLLDNSLELSEEALDLLDTTTGGRVSVVYHYADNGKYYPIIGRSECFQFDLEGNKLTKKRTISFRGEQNKMLRRYGESFKLTPFRDGVFKLTSI